MELSTYVFKIHLKYLLLNRFLIILEKTSIPNSAYRSLNVTMTLQRRNQFAAFSFVGEFRFSKKLPYIVIANRITKRFCMLVFNLFLLEKV